MVMLAISSMFIGGILMDLFIMYMISEHFGFKEINCWNDLLNKLEEKK